MNDFLDELEADVNAGPSKVESVNQVGLRQSRNWQSPSVQAKMISLILKICLRKKSVSC